MKQGSNKNFLALCNLTTATTIRTLTQIQRHVNKMFDIFPPKLNGEMLPMRFGFWSK